MFSHLSDNKLIRSVSLCLCLSKRKLEKRFSYSVFFRSSSALSAAMIMIGVISLRNFSNINSKSNSIFFSLNRSRKKAKQRQNKFGMRGFCVCEIERDGNITQLIVQMKNLFENFSPKENYLIPCSFF
ncbi:hypothetical protein SSS_00102 [Sarcoptes scabiei]|nr:hypothetical protein SSS_00102 [Sarcoptes scabiei]